MLKVCKICEKDAFPFYKIKSFNKEMILAQVFASLSMEGAIKVVICLLDAIKLIHFSQFLLDYREMYVFIFWYSSGVGKDTSNALCSIIISKNAVTSTNYPIITLIHYTLLKHSCIVSNLNDGFCSYFERHTKSVIISSRCEEN